MDVPTEDDELENEESWLTPERRERVRSLMVEALDDLAVKRKVERKQSLLVYFVRAKALGLIKIGIAREPFQRLSSLQSSSPDQLELLGVMASENAEGLEGNLHVKFRRFHSHREWFNPAPALLEYIMENAISPEAERRERMKRYASEAIAKLVSAPRAEPSESAPSPSSPPRLRIPKDPLKLRKHGSRNDILARYKAARGIA